uniref:Uncharacterized protein n=1 Tax=Eutreptiella gymnastica TaxID=73025 RepID=A0A7S1IYK1_9EUGL|mmetsp:Transcript_52086/g.92870  ORF Transcript_52086/g.92870 Transcript_52086/m.92870 type:complete len:100 (+) Transcript_52086:1711-2010(+)
MHNSRGTVHTEELGDARSQQKLQGDSGECLLWFVVEGVCKLLLVEFFGCSLPFRGRSTDGFAKPLWTKQVHVQCGICVLSISTQVRQHQGQRRKDCREI